MWKLRFDGMCVTFAQQLSLPKSFAGPLFWRETTGK
jgi:hypothetical protein